ncbi:hypothetical protein [Massilia sp. TWR1-2-2]|uniref:hypothetical protein n=1 Tax=Massilia sp. TWR1-2-2 TaxID=2804584 RepID=UPI003CEECD90
MDNLHWHLPLERCTTLDEIRRQWQGLLEQHHMTPMHNVPRYQDAMLCFLATSALAPHLKLAAVLANGSAFDFDFRLAVGLLSEHIDEFDTAWPEAVADAVMANGPRLPVTTSDAWLGAFVAGRMAGLRETFSHDGTRPDDWRSAFWNKFLETACRHAQDDGVRLALQHGADPRADGYAALRTPAAGVHTRFLHEDGHLTPERTDADYQRILLALLEGGLDRADMLAAALPSAAAADNTAMLEFLLAEDADIRADGAAALAAAARDMAIDALGWLLAHGANLHADGDAALIAGVASLDEATVEMLLAAGADLQGAGELALRTALTSRPYDLYSDESDLVAQRAEMVALLLRRGVRPTGTELVDALKDTARGQELIDEVLGRDDIGADQVRLLQVLAEQAFGASAGQPRPAA